MQIFLPYKEPLLVAQCLDKRRLWKQILEVSQIISVITGVTTSWQNHPIVKMYKENLDFLIYYKECLFNVYILEIDKAKKFNDLAMKIVPSFITDEFCEQHKRRLYAKNKEFYKDFSQYGESDENWYIVDGKFLKYKNGKLIIC